MSKLEELKADLAELRASVNNDKTPQEAKAAMRLAIPKIEARIAELENGEAKPTTKPKPEAKPKPEPNKPQREAELYWNKATPEAELTSFGKVEELETLPSTCRKLGITLARDARVFVKGDVFVTAKKGELVEMVHTGGSNWMQFNIIENRGDKCVSKGKPKSSSQYVKHKCGNYTTTDANIPPVDGNCNKLIDEASLKALDAYLLKAEDTKVMQTVGGNYLPARQLLHRQIVDHFVKGKACVRREAPVAIFMGGKPGAGKSTFVKRNSLGSRVKRFSSLMQTKSANTCPNTKAGMLQLPTAKRKMLCGAILALKGC